VKYLVDTHLLLWAAGDTKKLSRTAKRLLDDDSAQLWFSAASIWEVAIKNSLGRKDFRAEPRQLRRGLLDNGWNELTVTSEHAAAVMDLPAVHKDPFDRMLVAQTQIEGLTLLTSDVALADYPGRIRLV
jgi:PIN domain nuclease of toxin-antitoxin system